MHLLTLIIKIIRSLCSLLVISFCCIFILFRNKKQLVLPTNSLRSSVVKRWFSTLAGPWAHLGELVRNFPGQGHTQVLNQILGMCNPGISIFFLLEYFFKAPLLTVLWGQG